MPGRAGGRVVEIKLRWILLFSVGIGLLVAAVGLGAGLLLIEHDPWVAVTAFVATTLVVSTPALACLMVANLLFDLDQEDGRRFLRRFVYVTAGIQLLGVLGMVPVALAAPDSVGYLLGVVALSVVLLWCGVRLGTRFQRRLVVESAQHSAWSPWSKPRLRRAALRVVTVFALAGMIGCAAFVWWGFALDDGEGPSFGAPIVYGLSLGAIAAALACLVVSWPLVKDMRRVLGRDFATQKAIVRVVLRNKDDVLSEEAQHQAAAYAGIMAVYYRFQIAQFALLLGGLWLQQVWNLTSGPSDSLVPLTLGLVIGIPLVFLTILPFIIREARRAKRYAIDHAESGPSVLGESR